MEYYKNKSIESLNDEKWLPIIGYEGYYFVSNLGRIKSVDRTVVSSFDSERMVKGRVMKLFMDRKGYIRVMLCKEGECKNCQVHRLVALTFIKNVHNKPRVNHKLGVKHDNRVTELEWVTASEDELHSYRVLGKKNPKAGLGRIGKLHPKSKPVRCCTLDTVFESATQAAKALGIGQGNLCNYINNKKHNPTGLYFIYC